MGGLGALFSLRHESEVIMQTVLFTFDLKKLFKNSFLKALPKRLYVMSKVIIIFRLCQALGQWTSEKERRRSGKE